MSQNTKQNKEKTKKKRLGWLTLLQWTTSISGKILCLAQKASISALPFWKPQKKKRGIGRRKGKPIEMSRSSNFPPKPVDFLRKQWVSHFQAKLVFVLEFFHKIRYWLLCSPSSSSVWTTQVFKEKKKNRLKWGDLQTFPLNLWIFFVNNEFHIFRQNWFLF